MNRFSRHYRMRQTEKQQNAKDREVKSKEVVQLQDKLLIQYKSGYITDKSAGAK